MASLWASQADVDRLREADSAVVLVGGYDGSGNYGDVLQIATAIETVGGLAAKPLPVAVIEHETRGHHLKLVGRFPQLGGVVYLYFKNEGDAPADDLRELGPRSIPAPAAIYVYGGGFLNHRWGGRKVEHVAAVERSSRRRPLPLVASGLQVDEAAVAPGGVAHDLLSRALSIGVRDHRSLEYLAEHLPDPAGSAAELTGDDATPFMRPATTRPGPVVNLHLNDGVWVSDDPDAMTGRIVALLREIARASPDRLELQPIVAYEDPRVSERRVHAALFARFGEGLTDAGYAIVDPIYVLDDALDNELALFHRARLTIACSYHVTLTSLLSGIPTVLLAENEYYEQKAAGLRDLFDRDDDRLLGARGDDEDASAAAAALVDGPARERIVSSLGVTAAEVVERFERGRAAVGEALARGMQGRRIRAAFSRLRGG